MPMQPPARPCPDWVDAAWEALAAKASFSMRPRPWGHGLPLCDQPAAPSLAPRSVVFGISSDYGDGLLLQLLRSGHAPAALVTSTRFGHAPVGSFYQQAAQRLGIPLLAGENVHQPEILSVIGALRPDLIWVFSFDQIFRPALLDIPRLGMVNFHPSRLPAWRGPEPIWWQIASGETESGLTASRVTEGIDAGPILARSREPVRATDSSGSLTRRLLLGAGPVIEQVLAQARAGRLEGPLPDLSAGSYQSGVIGPRLDFSRPAVELERIVRAGLPDHPATVEDLDGRRFRVREARVVPKPAEAASGTLLALDPTGQTLTFAAGVDALVMVCSSPSGARARFA
ncbi:MAG: hypothetical protein KDH92_08745 [Chloroflexi bacterium]|nr:hypothetical protein [Chloroflexota bacterium]